MLGDGRAGARFRKNKGAVVGAAIVIALVLFAIVGPLFAAHDPYTSDFARGMTAAHTPSPPSAAFPLGADTLYRDVFARLATGARVSLFIAVSATLIACAIGAVVGIVAGWYEASLGVRVPWIAILPILAAAIAGWAGASWRGAIGAGAGCAIAIALAIALAKKRASLASGPRINGDDALMRGVDVALSFPFLLLVMALGAVLDETTAVTILLTLGLTGWAGTARVMRAKTMQVRGLDYVVASRALGQSTPRILARHVLPNVAGPLIVIATVSVAQMIIAEAVLGYLGVGISPPTPTWGHMLFEGQPYVQAAPWLLLAPGGAILLAVLGFNLLGEGLRDALDPRG